MLGKVGFAVVVLVVVMVVVLINYILGFHRTNPLIGQGWWCGAEKQKTCIYANNDRVMFFLARVKLVQNCTLSY